MDKRTRPFVFRWSLTLYKCKMSYAFIYVVFDGELEGMSVRTKSTGKQNCKQPLENGKKLMIFNDHNCCQKLCNDTLPFVNLILKDI